MQNIITKGGIVTADDCPLYVAFLELVVHGQDNIRCHWLLSLVPALVRHYDSAPSRYDETEEDGRNDDVGQRETSNVDWIVPQCVKFGIAE